MGLGGWLWFLCMYPVATESQGEAFCRLLETSSATTMLQKHGDITIGGLFPIHLTTPESDLSFKQKPEPSTCHEFFQSSYSWLQTMIFAVEEVNRNETLLPNLTVGYILVDSCLTEGAALSAALRLVTGEEATVLGIDCGHTPNVPVIIGDARSSSSIAIASTLGTFRIPLVSYYASCACLSDHNKYPTFFRTVPSDAFQARAIAHMLRLLGWTWVGVLAGDDDYGKSGVQLLLQELHSSEVCVAFYEVIPSVYSERIARIVETIKFSTVRVVVTFAIAPDMQLLLSEVVKQNITDKQWIGTEAWVSSPLLSTPQNLPSLLGTIGFALRHRDIQGLKAFLNRIRPNKFSDDPFVKDFWETTFQCSLEVGSLLSTPARPLCSGMEDLEDVQSPYSDTSQLRVSYNVYKAVYAIAYALHDMYTCQPRHGPFANGECPNVSKLHPWQLLHYLRIVNFTTPVGEWTHFDENGDPSASYDIINWQRGSGGHVNFVTVGHFDSVDVSHSTFNLNVKNVVWGGGGEQNEVPVSLCSRPCPPGTWRALQKGKPICCFDCLPCAEGEISNITGVTECTKCPPKLWPNEQRTECVMKTVEFLSYAETLGFVLAALSVCGAALTAVVTAVFFRHRDTPLVRANNSELSFLILGSLGLCFLCALAFIGRPTVWSCRLRHTLFSISFVLCMSCILSKTVVVLVAFRATLPGTNIMRYFGPLTQRVGLSLCTLIQVLICIVWLVSAPPHPAENTGQTSKIVLQCVVGSVAGFACVLGYIGLLAAVCFLLAFLARKLPDNFNEAKFITFSMLIFCAVWITFVPAYVSSPGKYTVAVEIFAILASSYGLLLCIFAPKCYIILLKPEKNTKKNMMGK